MENNQNSIFRKVAEIKDDQVESQELDKEKMYEDVRVEITELQKKKEEYLNLQKELESKTEELTTNHGEYHAALEKVLPLFREEENREALESKGVINVRDLQEQYADTSEVQSLSVEESQTKRNLNELKQMKEDLIKNLDVQNPQYKSIPGLIQFLKLSISQIDGQIFEKTADIPEGREEWPVRYPTGIFHKETEFEKKIKEEKEGSLRKMYHDLGDRIDSILVESIEEYNSGENVDEPMEMAKDYKKGRHILGRTSIEVDESAIRFQYGAGYSTLPYEIKSNSQGQLFFQRKDSLKMLQPDRFLQIINNKLSALDSSFKSVAEAM